LVTLDVLHSAGALICQSDRYTSGSLDLSQCLAKAALYSVTQITEFTFAWKSSRVLKEAPGYMDVVFKIHRILFGTRHFTLHFGQ
jgi:hypothetical protein